MNFIQGRSNGDIASINLDRITHVVYDARKAIVTAYVGDQCIGEIPKERFDAHSDPDGAIERLVVELLKSCCPTYGLRVGHGVGLRVDGKHLVKDVEIEEWLAQYLWSKNQTLYPRAFLRDLRFYLVAVVRSLQERAAQTLRADRPDASDDQPEA